MKSQLMIVSIGPGDPSFLNQATLEQIAAASPLILRTDHHPLRSFLAEKGIVYTALDYIYDESEDFDTLYDRIAQEVLRLAEGAKNPVYAVPDPMSDRTVDALFSLANEPDAAITVIPGFSYSDFYLSRCRGLFTAGNIRIMSAADISAYDPDDTTLITEIDQEMLAGDLKSLLSVILDDDSCIYILGSSGKPRKISLYELDRQKHYDHMTAVLIPSSDYMSRARHTMHDLLKIMERLRAPDGCPWDRIQTHESLQPYMVEEAWESIIAMDEKDPDHMADELGDLLFQIVFHASIGKAYDEFTMDDVISHICAKMISRHPHVFGSEKMTTPDEVLDKWETIKSAETGSKTVRESLDDVSPALPALKYAIKVNKKASVMPQWHMAPDEVAERIRKQAAVLVDEKGRLNRYSLGEMLFLCCLLCYRCGEDAEIILHKTVNRFKANFDQLKSIIDSDGKMPACLTGSECPE